MSPTESHNRLRNLVSLRYREESKQTFKHVWNSCFDYFPLSINFLHPKRMKTRRAEVSHFLQRWKYFFSFLRDVSRIAPKIKARWDCGETDKKSLNFKSKKICVRNKILSLPIKKFSVKKKKISPLKRFLRMSHESIITNFEWPRIFAERPFLQIFCFVPLIIKFLNLILKISQ
jgi:hypothetical protein